MLDDTQSACTYLQNEGLKADLAKSLTGQLGAETVADLRDHVPDDALEATITECGLNTVGLSKLRAAMKKLQDTPKSTNSKPVSPASASSSVNEDLRLFLQDEGLGELEETLYADGVRTKAALGVVQFTAKLMPNTFKKAKSKPALELCASKAFDKIRAAHQNDTLAATQASAEKENQLAKRRKTRLALIGDIKNQLQPFIDEVAEEADKRGAEAKAAREQAKSRASVQLQRLGVAFDASLGETPEQLMTYARELEEQITGEVANKPDFTNGELIEKNSLLKGLLLYPQKVVKANGSIASLIHPDNPGLLPVAEKDFVREHSELTSTRNLRSMRDQSESIGSSWGASASTKGAAFVGGAVAAWSASTQLSAAKDHVNASRSNSEVSKVSYVKKTSAVRYMCQLSLGDADYHLSHGLEGALDGIEQAVDKEVNFKALECLREYGSHLVTRADLGGTYSFEAHMTTSGQGNDSSKEEAIGNALSVKIQAAVGAASFMGAGGASAGLDHESDAKRNDSEAQRNKELEKSVEIRQFNIGGGPDSSLPRWLAAVAASNRSWRVLDRDPDTMQSLWSVVRKKAPAKKRAADALEKVWVQVIMSRNEVETEQKLLELCQSELKPFLLAAGQEQNQRRQARALSPPPRQVIRNVQDFRHPPEEVRPKLANVDWQANNLDLSSERLDDQDAKALAEAFKVNTTIKEVALGGNGIGDEGAKALAEAFKVNTTIKEVGLYRNSIGDEGAKAIAEGLKVNESVKTISLHSNDIGNEGAKAIAESLKENQSVKKIYLGLNEIGDTGAKAIRDALKVNKTVKEVWCDFNAEDMKRLGFRAKDGDDGNPWIRD